MDLIKNPRKYTRSTSYGAASYVKNLCFDEKTGEIHTPAKSLKIDESKIKKEENLDGYYVIVTSEYQESDDRVIDIYRGLWKIEESFRVTKSDLQTRPVYVSSEDHIQAHFLICFLALIIARILGLRLNRKYSIAQMKA